MSDSMRSFEDESINVKVLCELMDRVTDSWEYAIEYETSDYSIEEYDSILLAHEGGIKTFQMLLIELSQYLKQRGN